MRFGVGSVLATSLALYARRFGPLFALTVLSFAVMLGGTAIAAHPTIRWWVGHLVLRLQEIHPVLDESVLSLRWIPSALLAGTVAIYVVGRLRDEPVAFWRALGRALRRSHVLVGVALVVRLVTFGLATLVAYLRWGGNRYWSPRLADIVLGQLAWIAGATLVVAALAVAAVERRGVVGSLARSWRLAAGAWGRVFAVMLLVVGAAFAVHYLLAQVMIFGRPFDERRFELFGYLRFGLEILLAALSATVHAVIYEKLRAAKEGPADAQLQRVFD